MKTVEEIERELRKAEELYLLSLQNELDPGSVHPFLIELAGGPSCGFIGSTDALKRKVDTLRVMLQRAKDDIPQKTASNSDKEIKAEIPCSIQYDNRTLMEWVRDLFPNYTPLKPGRKPKKLTGI
jgi:hypothetical protein